MVVVRVVGGMRVVVRIVGGSEGSSEGSRR